MERAASAVIFAGLLKLNAMIHHVDNIDAVEQSIDKALWDHAGHNNDVAKSKPLVSGVGGQVSSELEEKFLVICH
jgi:hypothetical protein